MIIHRDEMTPVIGLDISKEESQEEFDPFKKRGEQLLNLRYLTRQYESLSKMCVQTKLQCQAVLDQVFPAYKGVFGAMYSGITLRFSSEFPSSYSVLQTDKDTLKAKMKELLSSKRGRSEDWISERVKRFNLLIFITHCP